MKTDLLRPFESLPYFTIEGFRQATGMETPHQVRILLYRWAKAGHILQLKKGVYMTRRFYELHSGDYLFSAAVSSILVPQSYLSLEFILQQASILTEVTYPVTCVTTKNTREITNRIGTFWYRHLKEELYHGFTISDYFGIRVCQASPSKALFDYLYLRPIPKTFLTQEFDLAGELRLNLEEFSKADRSDFTRLIRNAALPKMRDILENFKAHIWRH